MDFKLIASTFVMIFIAELGDKTQFAAVAASASSKSTWSVLIGVTLGLATAGALGVLAGKILGQAVNPNLLRWISGSLFIVVGIWVLARP